MCENSGRRRSSVAPDSKSFHPLRSRTSGTTSHERFRRAEIRNGCLAASRRGWVADPRKRPLHDRCDAGGDARRLCAAFDGGACADQGRKPCGGAKRPRCASRLDRRRRERPCADAVPRDGSRQESGRAAGLSGALRRRGEARGRRHRFHRGGRPEQREIRRRADRGRLRRPPGDRRYGLRPCLRRASRLARSRLEPRLPVRGRRQGGDGRRLCQGGEGRGAHDRQQPARLQLHGAARRRCGIRRRERPLHGHPRVAGRAWRPRRDVHGVEDRAEDDARADLRRRRRLRHQGFQLSRIPADREGREGARAAGQVGVRSERALPRRRARARPRVDRRRGARCEWPHHRAEGRVHRGHGVLLQPVRSVHPLARDHHADGRL